MATARPDRFKEARRLARRGRRCKTEPEIRQAWRQMIRAMLHEMAPKIDGTHPLDADNVKLEGE